jgi:hypothetical protein
MFALLFLSAFALLTVVNPATAYYGHDYNYGAASELYSIDWKMTDSDLYLKNTVISQIYNMFNAHSVYGHLWNFASDTFAWRVQQQIINCESSSHNYATFFYYGHMGMESVGLAYPEYSYGFREHRYQGYQYVPPAVWDRIDIYQYTHNPSHYRFVFLWVCNNGNVRGYEPPVHGMPYCWTHMLLSQDGYGNGHDDSDYCFIGFQEASCRLSEQISVGHTYKDWLYTFYTYALNGYPIHSALDWASYDMGFFSFEDPTNPLYSGFWTLWPDDGQYYWGKMRIYGDSFSYLPI